MKELRRKSENWLEPENFFQGAELWAKDLSDALDEVDRLRRRRGCTGCAWCCQGTPPEKRGEGHKGCQL